MKQKQINQNWKEFELKDGNGRKIILKLDFTRKSQSNFVAKANALRGRILIGSLFSKFLKEEQEAILFHEYWHIKNNLKFEVKIFFSSRFWVFFSQNRLMKLQEFEADKYAALHAGKNILIKVLEKISQLERKGKIKYNYKNHPSIDERLKNIK